MSEKVNKIKPPSPTPSKDATNISSSSSSASFRRNKPQTLLGIEATQKLNNTKLIQPATTIDINIQDIRKETHKIRVTNIDTTTATTTVVTAASLTTSTIHMARNRARTRASGIDRDEREHSCDGVIGVRSHLTTANLTGGVDENITIAKSDKAGSDIDLNRRSSAGNSSITTTEEFIDLNKTSRRESLNYDDTSPSGHNFTKSLFGRSLRYPAGGVAGATTRKCVLTLDGYSYVIVASTPENLPKRDEPTGIGNNNTNIGSGSSGTAISGATTSSGNIVTSAETSALSERSKVNSPTSKAAGVVSGNSTNASGSSSTAFSASTEANICSQANAAALAALNGQVARHGSLTIVRRSNSRKNFTQIADTQQTSTATTPLSASASPLGVNQNIAFNSQQQQNIPTTSCSSQQFLKTPVSDDFSSNIATASTTNTFTATTIATTNPYDNRSNILTSEAIKFTGNKTTAQAISASKPQTIFTGISPAGISATTIASAITTTTNAMQPTSPNATNFRPTSEREHESPEGSNDSLTDPSSVPTLQIDLATENLPAVDTPDACDKAALRLRHLLRLLNNGEVSAEVLRKNLHYAARVLEAVFIDESKDPHLGRTSSVDDEDQMDGASAKARCNGNCKNLGCSQHSHERHSCLSSSSSANTSETVAFGNTIEVTTTTNQDNNNTNSNCSLEQQQQTQNYNQGNQTSIDSRTKGVTLTPQTHGGPTGPPQTDDEKGEGNGDGSSEVTEAVEITKSAEISATNLTTITTATSSSSSSTSKATMQRQKRLRTPVWARTTSTNKMYMIFKFK